MMTRRSLLAFSAFAGLGFYSTARAESPPAVTVHKDANCGCCGLWVDHLREAGFAVSVNDAAALWAIKQRLGVPQALTSCHTAEVAGYIVEGHVPASAILRLLDERPEAIGLAVPGMPIGSPGMEVEGHEPETYDVVLFGSFGDRVYARYKGADPA